MARGDKPYRVYRGGRIRGGVPTLARPERDRRDGRRPERRVPVERPPRRRLSWRARIVLGFAAVVVGLVLWAVTSYLAFRSGVAAANERLDPAVRAALVPQDGLTLSTPATILLLGTDHSATVAARQTARRSDSIMLVRTDPSRHRLAFLSIPRDLRVDIPGHGPGKMNAAFQLGGAVLALRTVRGVTGLPINHVAVVDFGAFEELIDAMGGITVDVPRPIVANRFDCPYATRAECRRWRGWRFEKGEQEMNGRRALVYARIRENRLDPSETDLTRSERQQAVVQAIGRKLLRPTTLARMPFIGDDVARPLATDLTANEFVQLAWLRFRAPAGQALHCRLGGTPSAIGGESFLIGSEDNVATIAMFTGASAPQPPAPGSGPFGPGCLIGQRGSR